MLDTLYLLLTHLCLGYVVYWVVKNDGARKLEDQTGLLRMRAERTGAERRKFAPKGRSGGRVAQRRRG